MKKITNGGRGKLTLLRNFGVTYADNRFHKRKNDAKTRTRQNAIHAITKAQTEKVGKLADKIILNYVATASTKKR